MLLISQVEDTLLLNPSFPQRLRAASNPPSCMYTGGLLPYESLLFLSASHVSLWAVSRYWMFKAGTAASPTTTTTCTTDVASSAAMYLVREEWGAIKVILATPVLILLSYYPSPHPPRVILY